MSLEPVRPVIALHRAEVGDVSIFYREAGDPERPTILLLHGFPSSSHQFRDLIPRLANRYHLVAPDLPGFGFTIAPEGFDYSFARLAKVMESFTDAIGLKRYAVYIFDYGAPVGLRLALARPGAITAIISQNGNAYEEGLSDGWAQTKAFWADPSPANREAMRGMFTLETTRWQYTHGVPDETQVAPEAYWLDYTLMSRPGNVDIQLGLIADYVSNVALYPRFHQYFRDRQPPLLAVWGANDPFFVPAGAEAFRRDLPKAEVHFLATGHFALETHGREVADHIRDFLGQTST
ncbi:alpha/beta fold hydrolase [Nitrospirillum iridis]|uniref:Pimeloyl-ACP methyl ester carboxylesterase n=1 Tax=Nitrospirillum iridis TaxID=765888 RepID=A0A7X0B270_9PROT|nr:alpha/beta hydrolase [Nitrospirillum iridis]MBB6254404.1 pimeloyl-ACP methyl ester carboxylesterase [Nitrospirillum iridis]